MEHIFETIMRSILAFAIVMIIARTLGKPTVSLMTYHDFVTTITLGSLTANLAFNVSMTVWQMAASMLTFSGISYLLMVLALKSRALRKRVSGTPPF